jgi:hypothetical protein
MEQLQTPVLLIIYKRLETTQRVLEKIRGVRPAKLYVSANAPNPVNPDDEKKCDETRSIVREIDWPCEVITNFRTHHLSAKDSISSGITWFFSREEEGIILEDDCVVDESFFWFAQEMLSTYRNDQQVMHIGASNFQDGIWRGDGSYYFSRFNHIWGWAGWRRSWSSYDVNFTTRSEKEFLPVLKQIFQRRVDQQYWIEIFKYLKSGFVDTWDSQYMFSMWTKHGIAITPNVNLVKNIGFGKDATNTHSPLSKWANLEVESLQTIVHPSTVKINDEADLHTADNFYGVSKSGKQFHIKLKIARYLSPSFKKKLRAVLKFV